MPNSNRMFVIKSCNFQTQLQWKAKKMKKIKYNEKNEENKENNVRN